jgi:arsenite methyltransferase
MSILEINKRYSELASTDCCLSCGGAINHAEAKLNEVCIDLGSGRGTDAIRLAETVGSNGTVYGIDISDGMIEKAIKTAERMNVPNVRFIKSSLEHIPLETGIADLIISNCTINHAADKQMVWNEIYRMLRPGGRFVISDIYAITPIPEEYRNDPVAISECWAGSVIRSEYLLQLERAGFSGVNIIEESAPYPKGKVDVSSWTISAHKPKDDYSCCC